MTQCPDGRLVARDVLLCDGSVLLDYLTEFLHMALCVCVGGGGGGGGGGAEVMQGHYVCTQFTKSWGGA